MDKVTIFADFLLLGCLFRRQKCFSSNFWGGFVHIFTSYRSFF